MSVYYWESGAHNPRHDNINRIASACGVSVAMFWSETPKPTRSAS